MICSFLTSEDAKYDGSLFSAVPSPIETDATSLENRHVVKLFTEAPKVSDDADDIVNILDPLSLKSSGQRKVINVKQVEEEDTVDDAVDCSNKGHVTFTC